MNLQFSANLNDAVAQEAIRGNSASTFDLVRCKLTLFYDYWQMNEILEALLPRDMQQSIGIPGLLVKGKRLLNGFAHNDVLFQYMEKNSVLNKLERHIEIFNMDGRRFIDAMFASQKAHSITQMHSGGMFKDKPKDKEYALPMIHVYGFSKARDPEFDFHERIRIALQEVAVNVEMRRVRQVAPGKWMLCASFRLPKSVAYAHAMLRM
ncbi:hypothetical protein OIU78_025189 [Salix suchowensis]|nr:hypothetical protein OIU78_025189 [Salix suchowensis]